MKAIPEPNNPNELWCNGCEDFKFAGLFTEAQKKQTGGLSLTALGEQSGEQSHPNESTFAY
jgi:hypothetical protein